MNHFKYIIFYVFGVLILLVGFVLFFVDILKIGFESQHVLTEFNDSEPVAVAIPEAGSYSIHYHIELFNEESLSLADDPFGLVLNVIDTNNGEEIDLELSTEITRHNGDKEVLSQGFDFYVSEPTTIEVSISSEVENKPIIDITVYRDFVATTLSGMSKGIKSVLQVIILGLIGFTMLIVTMMMHVTASNKHKSRQVIHSRSS